MATIAVVFGTRKVHEACLIGAQVADGCPDVRYTARLRGFDVVSWTGSWDEALMVLGADLRIEVRTHRGEHTVLSVRTPEGDDVG